MSFLINLPSSREIFVDGQNICLFQQKKLQWYRRHVLGFLIQFPERNVLWSLSAFLEIIHFRKRKDNPFHELSCGKKQIVEITRALANNSKVVLTDEPPEDMDSVTGRAIIELFERINKKYDKTLIIVTHDESLVGKGKYLVCLEDRKVIDDLIMTESLEVPEYTIRRS